MHTCHAVQGRNEHEHGGNSNTIRVHQFSIPPTALKTSVGACQICIVMEVVNPSYTEATNETGLLVVPHSKIPHKVNKSMQINASVAMPSRVASSSNLEHKSSQRPRRPYRAQSHQCVSEALSWRQPLATLSARPRAVPSSAITFQCGIPFPEPYATLCKHSALTETFFCSGIH